MFLFPPSLGAETAISQCYSESFPNLPCLRVLYKIAVTEVGPRACVQNRPMSTDTDPSFNFDPENLALKLRITLAAQKSAVDPVVRSVMNIVKQMDCLTGKEKEDDIELALAEALANAVEHGAKSDPTQIVECDVACDESRGMLIVVRDPGAGFDPGTIPSPLRGENVYSNRGRGIYLINQLMDEVKYFKNGTEIHMVKH
jgi:serine/threonine-protein kinase RsbW